MRQKLWSWLWIVLGALYFVVPLYATADFSLRATKGVLSFRAYENVFKDPKFAQSFLFSLEMAVLTILVSLILIVPTAYWVQLRLPKLRRLMEFLTLFPFVVPAVVLAFGLIRIYSRPQLGGLLPPLLNTPALLVASYMVLALPYVYRATDTGLRAIDVHTLTEAAQSLGANWATILFSVIFPNLRVALLSGAFLTFATVMGEFTLASLLVKPAFGPYMQLLASSKVYEPSAIAVISFSLTWACIGVIQLIGRRSPAQTQLAATK